MKKAVLRIGQIRFDKKYYPRTKWYWQTSYKYSQAMKSGAKFPPIEVAKLRRTYYLVDGRHRYEAYKLNKEQHVQVVINPKIKSFNDLYIVAIRRNIGHGLPLSAHDITNIVIRLKDMKLDLGEISHIINMPINKLEPYIAKSITNTVSGEKIALKAPLKHLAGQEVSDEVGEIQKDFTVYSQLSLLEQLIDLLENELINFENPRVRERLEKIVVLINQFVTVSVQVPTK